MDKRALRKVPFSRPKAVDFLFNSTNESCLRTVANCFTTNVNHKRILVMDLFMRDKVYRHFISKNKGRFEYITLNMQTNNWLSADLGTLHYCDGPYNTWAYVISANKTAIINKEKVASFLELNLVNDDVISSLRGFEEQLKYENRARKEAEEQKKVNKFMDMVPKLTKKQIAFLSDNKAYFGFYKEKNVYCTHCGKEHIAKDKPKAKTVITCPHCNATILLATTRNKSKRECYDRFIFSKVKGIPVIRHFKVYQEFIDYKHPTYSYREFARDIVYKGKVHNFSLYIGDKYWTKGRYCDYDSYGHDTHYTWGRLYKDNLDTVLKDTDLQYCALQHYPDYAEIKWDWYVESYLKYPMLEALVKAGCFRIVENILCSHQDTLRKKYYGNDFCKKLNVLAKTPYEFIGVNKFVFNKVAKYDFGRYELESYIKILNSKFSMLEKDVLFLINQDRNYNYSLEPFLNHCREVNISPHKMIKYLNGQTDKEFSFSDATSDWNDYLECCKALNIDIKKFATPENLQEEHDRVFALKKIKNSRETKERFDAFFNDTLQYIENTVIGNYCFRILSGLDDFVRQGNLLKQCVGRGGYYEGTANRKKFIVSISEMNLPDKPLYTLEVMDGVQKQLRGYRNKGVPDTIKDVTKLYLNEINKRLNYNGDNGIELRHTA